MTLSISNFNNFKALVEAFFQPFSWGMSGIEFKE